jgi:DNA polymerase III alpha subunit
MRTDKYDQYILSENDICGLYLRDPDSVINHVLVENVKLDPTVELERAPRLVQYTEPTLSIEEFDEEQQANWLMPQEYKDLDIAEWVLDQCETDHQRQRVGLELLLYLERDLFPLLQYLLYLVDTMRANNIVWGVGRGSSVASYVLFLIGVHKIDSMYYDLDISEFLK